MKNLDGSLNLNQRNKSDDSKKINIPEKSEELATAIRFPFGIAKRITKNSSPLYLCGGSVRNLLTKHDEQTDFDFIGNFDIEQIAKDYPEFIIKKWGELSTIKLQIGSATYDFISSPNIESTLLNNDITISNLCLNENGQILDFVGGLESLEKKEIKILNPEEKIKKDPSRIIRVIRFSEQFDYSIEQETLATCIKYANMVKSSQFSWELEEITNLSYELRQRIFDKFEKYGIFDEEFLRDYKEDLRTINVKKTEEKIIEFTPIKKLRNIFPERILFAGGGVRNIIWDKNIGDIDIKINLSLNEIITRLISLGYIETINLNLLPNQYYINEKARAISILVDSVDIDITETHGQEYKSLIQLGDINLNCCVFDVHKQKMLNPEMVNEIDSKKLKFSNPQRVAEDPLIVVNALKQISRTPDISIPEETLLIIEKNIPAVVKIIRDHPELKYKIQSFCGNINSEQAIDLFKNYGGEELFKNFTMRKEKVKITNPKYQSLNMADTSEKTMSALIELFKQSYKDAYDEKKLFPPNINHVIIEKEGEKIITCCCMDGERIYSAASINGLGLIKIFHDVVHNNYNIWGTVDASNAKVIAITLMAGMKLEFNHDIVKKIMESKDQKYKDTLRVYTKNHLTVFDKENSKDYPQVLVRN